MLFLHYYIHHLGNFPHQPFHIPSSFARNDTIQPYNTQDMVSLTFITSCVPIPRNNLCQLDLIYITIVLSYDCLMDFWYSTAWLGGILLPLVLIWFRHPQSPLLPTFPLPSLLAQFWKQ